MTHAKSRLLLLSATLFVWACSPPADTSGVGVTAFEGARLITGDGSVVEDAVVLVDGGLITAAGASADIDIPGGATSVDLSGKTVMPALVNAHFHLASTEAERTEQLQHLAYYGAGAALSLGLDEGPVGLEMRSTQIPNGARSQSAGRGITSPEPGRSEVPFWVTTEEEARTAVQELAASNVDIVKVWVDDRGGQYERLSPELYGAVIDEAHQNGLRVTAHVFTLEDAKGLLRAGIDAFAHGIRDQDVDDELVELWQSRPEVVLVPNLPGPGVASDLGWLGGTVPAAQLQEMQEGAVDRPAAQEAFGIQARNLVRLHEAGIKVAFGTDGGAPWSVHQELEDMVRAGLPESTVLTAATSSAAQLMELNDVGMVAPGYSADFLVLNGNPLQDITETRNISDVYLAGQKVEREALATQFLQQEPAS
ncbi:MAG: amidohydrolase family protein [Longimicrobiales bacterium]